MPERFSKDEEVKRDKNLIDRYNEVKEKGEKLRTERLMRERIKQEEEEKNMTFQPQITKKAKQMKKQSSDVKQFLV